MSESLRNSNPNYIDRIADSWINVRQRVFARRRDLVPVDEAAEEPSVSPFGAELGALAIFNEDLRARCKDILNRTDELISLRDDFIDVFNEVGKVLDEAEETSSMLVERTSILAQEARDHAELKARHRELREESDRQQDDNSLLRSEAQRCEDLIANREERIESLERELVSANDRISTLSGELEQALCWGDSICDKLAAAESEIEANRSLIADLHADAGALNDRCSAAEFHAEKLESCLAEKQVEHDVAVEFWRQQNKAAVDEGAKLKAQLEAQRSRAEAAETLLSDARSEALATAERLRDRDLQLERLRVDVAPLEESLSAATAEIASLSEKLAQGEKSRALLADRAQALIRTLADQKAMVEAANERSTLLEQRLAAETARAAAESEELDAKLREMSTRLERERNAHLIASSALEAARNRAERDADNGSVKNFLPEDSELGDGLDLEKIGRKPQAQTQRTNPSEGTEVVVVHRQVKPANRAKRSLPKVHPLVVQHEG